MPTPFRTLDRGAQGETCSGDAERRQGRLAWATLNSSACLLFTFQSYEALGCTYTSFTQGAVMTETRGQGYKSPTSLQESLSRCKLLGDQFINTLDSILLYTYCDQSEGVSAALEQVVTVECIHLLTISLTESETWFTVTAALQFPPQAKHVRVWAASENGQNNNN